MGFDITGPVNGYYRCARCTNPHGSVTVDKCKNLHLVIDIVLFWFDFDAHHLICLRPFTASRVETLKEIIVTRSLKFVFFRPR